MTLADIVYVVRRGDVNEELRYSLRSLINVDYGDVYLAGYMPSWVQGAGYVKVDSHFDKYRSSTLNLEAACLNPYVSDPFWLMNDDFFIMDRLPELPTYHRGPVTDVIPYYLDTYPNSPYLRGMQATLDLLHRAGYDYPLSYELHIPLLVHKEPMLQAIAVGRNVRAFHKRTFYGNLSGLGGTYSDDVKVRPGILRDWTTWPLLSTSDQIFREHEVGTYIRERFSTASVYEREPLHRSRRVVGSWARSQSKQVIRYEHTEDASSSVETTPHTGTAT